MINSIRNSFSSLGLVIILLCLSQGYQAKATTIQPYTNLGELAKNSDNVVLAKVVRNFKYEDGNTQYFRSRLEVLESVKGSLDESLQFDVDKWERMVGNDRLTMWGDIDLREGHTYLLFLHRMENGTYRPICFSYYVHEEMTREGVSYLVPSEHAAEFETITEHAFEAPAVHEKSTLFSALRGVLLDRKEWSIDSHTEAFSLSDFYGTSHARGAEPSHCSYLTSGGLPLRWEGFADAPVTVRYVSDDSTSCSQTNELVRGCVSSLNENYPGIRLRDGGLVPDLDNCTNFSAVGYNYQSWIDKNLPNDERNIIVQYDDPCNEFPPLSNCSGVIAIGGLYNIGNHTWKNEDWRSGGYGYVVLNKDAAACLCGGASSRLADVLEHELSHALGLGHISTEAGHANMNPRCCHDISSLDQECANHVYLSSALLPIALRTFEGTAELDGNALRWETSFEQNVSSFSIERSDSPAEHFISIAEVASLGDSDFGHQYAILDRDAPREARYRLRSIDHDGEEELSAIIHLQRPLPQQPQLYPSHARTSIFVDADPSTTYQYIISSMSGLQLKTGPIRGGHKEIGIANLPSGTYIVQLVGARDQVHTRRFFKE
ncbi:MAG: T9SS type A sorting domain-containing protein [Saprospiraceae bacterium]|nr:T9SS type A sorting domain-containing protein [Saprospiraceae bacterium]